MSLILREHGPFTEEYENRPRFCTSRNKNENSNYLLELVRYLYFIRFRQLWVFTENPVDPRLIRFHPRVDLFVDALITVVDQKRFFLIYVVGYSR